MFNFLKKLFGKKVDEPVKTKRKYVRKKETIDRINIEREMPIINCKTCDRKTLIKSHSVKDDKFYFTITCPKCGQRIEGIGNTLQNAKLDAITKWNKANSKEEPKPVEQPKPAINVKNKKHKKKHNKNRK